MENNSEQYLKEFQESEENNLTNNIEENQKNYAQPVMILFSNNERVDFTDVKFQKALHIADIMKTMDNRLKVDRATLKQYKSDPKTREQAKRYLEKRKKLVAAGRL